ncbi:hypothetical protein [Weissella confusa]|uniref:hypothetical protein n=1 Tax=Weissella confusa TaxID=1583 RepID=UPI0010815B21|nr:hypothetical protein [Weissella confusa]TGE71049.1 hypothetical protein C6P15_01935 [Weissella confusa]
MPRGKNIPVSERFPEPTKLSAVIDSSTRISLEKIAAQLFDQYGYIPTQGQTIDYLTKYFLNENGK